MDYKLYVVNLDGHIHRRIDLSCADDNAAIEQAKSFVDLYDLELWSGARVVERIPARQA